MRIWIGNMAPGTTDDEIKALLKKYASNSGCRSQRRPAARRH